MCIIKSRSTITGACKAHVSAIKCHCGNCTSVRISWHCASKTIVCAGSPACESYIIITVFKLNKFIACTVVNCNTNTKTVSAIPCGICTSRYSGITCMAQPDSDLSKIGPGINPQASHLSMAHSLLILTRSSHTFTRNTFETGCYQAPIRRLLGPE